MVNWFFLVLKMRHKRYCHQVDKYFFHLFDKVDEGGQNMIKIEKNKKFGWLFLNINDEVSLIVDKIKRHEKFSDRLGMYVKSDNDLVFIGDIWTKDVECVGFKLEELNGIDKGNR